MRGRLRRWFLDSELIPTILLMLVVGGTIWLLACLGLFYLFDWLAGDEFKLDTSKAQYDLAFVFANVLVGMLIGLFFGRVMGYDQGRRDAERDHQRQDDW